MSKLTPQQAQAKQARNLKASVEDIKAGVARVTEAPGVKAAAKAEKMRQNIDAALASGKWQRRVAAVPLDEWKRQMIEKGTTRIGSGIDGAAGKVTAFYEELFPYQDQLKSKVDQMPDLTLDDNLNRMTAFVRGMAGFKRSK